MRPVFEKSFAAWSMARNKLALLFDLTETYYVVSKYGMPQQDCEVFLALVSRDANRALALIQRLLNLAAAGDDETGVELELEPGARRLCRGDDRTWTWHERDQFGPKSCVAALTAVRWFADALVSSGASLQEVVDLLLRDCENLAMPGFVVAFLLRHIESVTGELDRWLVQSEVWELEYRRRLFDPASRGSDADRRGRDVGIAAAQLVIGAIERRDQERIAALKAIGLELLNRVQTYAATDGADMAIVARRSLWADILNADNYRSTWHEGKLTSIGFVPPPRDTHASVEETGPESDAEGRIFKIGLRYSGVGVFRTGVEIRDDVIGRLADDLAFVQEIAVCSPDDRSASRTIQNVGITAVVASAEGKIALAASDFEWVANYLMDAPLTSRDDRIGLDEEVGVALVTLLHPVFFSAGVDYRRLERSLTEHAKALLNGLDDSFGHRVEPLWSAICPSASRCPHEVAWTAIEEVVRRDCRWERGGSRFIKSRLQGPLEEVLPKVPTEELTLDCIPGVLTACIHAAHSACCVADRARSLLDVLLDAYGRALRSQSNRSGWPAEGNKGHRRVAGALFVTAARGDRVPLVAHIRALADSPTALEVFLRDLSCQATHTGEVRRVLPMVWPLVMATVLDLRMPDDHRYRAALAVLPPEPRVSRQDQWRRPTPVDLAPLANALGVTTTNPDEILSTARGQWIAPEALRDLIERWIPVVQGEPRAVGALVGLVRTAPVSWQVATGLRWIERLIGGDYYRIAMFSGDLLDWLVDLHASERLAPHDATVFHRIVDALVAEGSQRAVALQRKLE